MYSYADTAHTQIQKRAINVLLFLCIFCFSSFSAEEYGIFDHYTVNDGLISNRVFSLTTDKNGFIWASTDFGLEQFDGKNFIHHRKKDYPELPREDFIFVHRLKNGNITAGGYNGLLVEYNPEKDIFKNVMPKEFNETFYKESLAITYSSKGTQYVITNAGAYTFDKEKNEYSSDNILFRITKNMYVRSLHIDLKGRYWIGSIDSVVVKNANGTPAYTYSSKGEAGSFVRTIIPLGDNKLAVASQKNEIWIFDESADNISDPVIVKTPFSCITNIIRDRSGRYWFPTDGNGLWYTNQELTQKATFTKLIPYNASTDEMNKIYSIIEDHDGEIWFSTQNSGIWRYRKNSISGISTSSDFGFPPAVCTAFTEDDDHNLIVSVDGGGLYSITPKQKIKKLISLPNNNISDLTRTPNGICYAATWGGGLYQYNPKTNSAKREQFTGISNPCNSFFGINTLNGTDLYACSAGDGLYRLRKNDSHWSRILLNDSVSDVSNKWIMFSYSDSQDAIWVSSSSALWLLKNSGAKLVTKGKNNEKKLVPLQVFDMKGDGNGYVFAASNDGIKRITPNGDIEDIDFVPTCLFRIILKDDDGKYWAAGDSGIYTFDYKSRTCSKLPGNFSAVATNYFYYRAGYKASDGKLYFGTNVGYLCVDPKGLSLETTIRHLSFSTLSIGNKKIAVSEAPLNGTQLSEKTEIELPYGMTDVSFSVQLADFAVVDKAQCQYRLVGLQDEWQNVSSDRIIRFSYIPTGKYTLEVRAFRSNDKCEEKTISLNLTILPPLWQTWWFITLSIIAIVLLSILIHKRRVRRLVEKKNELNEQVTLRTIELKNALKDKDNLISVIGHDLRNPMFAIVVALENWLKKEPTMSNEAKHHLIEEVLKSAKTLQSEMLKLLKWARSKQNDIVCKPQDIDIEDLVNNALLLSEELLKEKGITCHKDISITHKAYADDRMVSTVIRNILGNAIKYTNRNGDITIKVWEDTREMHIAVKDTGVGMPADVLAKIRSGNQTEMTSRSGTDNEEGTGLGLNICKNYIQQNNGTLQAESKEGEGTCITISLPISVSEPAVIQNNPTETLGKEQIPEEIVAGNVILVVDDNPLICENMKALLSDICEVKTANNGKEALDIVSENEIDLILSDVDMPVMDGIEFCTRLQQDESASHIPLLFVSGRIEENVRLQGLSKGAIDYITKPFNQEELLIKLCSLFNHRALMRSHILANIMQNKDLSDKANEPETAEEDNAIIENNPFLIKFMDTIRQKYTDPRLSVEDLAEDMCVSTSTLLRRIKTVVGKSPGQLLGEFRLNEAMRQLKSDENLSISDVAYAVGFSDLSYFCKKFKAYFGVSPTVARTKND